MQPKYLCFFFFFDYLVVAIYQRFFLLCWTLGKQVVQTLMGCHILLYLIWVYSS